MKHIPITILKSDAQSALVLGLLCSVFYGDICIYIFCSQTEPNQTEPNYKAIISEIKFEEPPQNLHSPASHRLCCRRRQRHLSIVLYVENNTYLRVHSGLILNLKFLSNFIGKFILCEL